MELINRQIQREILEALGDVYPNWVVPRGFCHDHNFERAAFAVNVEYLIGHGLIEQIEVSPLVNRKTTIRISHAGIDFLQGDGGLTAILGVVTFRMHEDTVRDLLIARVNAEEASDTVKGSLIKQIREMPAESLKTVTTAALQAGITGMPQFIHWLSGLLS